MKSLLGGIAGNAGADGSIVVEKIKDGKGNFGFNAASLEYGDMIKYGIVDPAKVTRSAIQNAGSVSSLLLTTEAMIVDKPEENDGGGAALLVAECQWAEWAECQG